MNMNFLVVVTPPSIYQFVDILFSKFLTDSLINTFLSKVGHHHVRFGTLNAFVMDDFWHIFIGEGSRCLSNDDWLIDINVGYPKLTI